MNGITLRLGTASAEDAERFLAALAPDNGDFLTVRSEGHVLILEATAAMPLGLLRTVEDALQCLHAAGFGA